MFILEHKPGSLTLIRLGFLKVAFPEGVGGGGGGGGWVSLTLPAYFEKN